MHGWVMTRSQQYRRTGEDLLQIADNCRYSEQRSLWITLAQAWFKLADASDASAARMGRAEQVAFADDRQPAQAQANHG
jgi:hypothetical protein